MDDGDSDSESDEDDQDVKDARAQRLCETGGWLGYLKDFTIFIPFIIPRGDLKVQFCLLVCIFTLILELEVLKSMLRSRLHGVRIVHGPDTSLGLVGQQMQYRLNHTNHTYAWAPYATQMKHHDELSTIFSEFS